MNKNDKYAKQFYDFEEDIKEYPDAWVYLVIGGRNTGKTYSVLKKYRKEGKVFGFIKRTNNDIKTLCAGAKIGKRMTENDARIDFSPFKSLNRDIGWNVHAFKIPEVEVGGFWDCNEEGNPHGDPCGYIFSLHAIGDIKGFDVTDIKVLVFDEFIPKKWERADRTEGDQLMDLYKTVDRGREHIGLEPLKLICLANATTVDNPVFNTLEVTDTVVDMKAKGIDKLYIEERGIFIHILEMNEEFMEIEQQGMIYKAMHNTNWGRMAFDNDFGYDDFTAVGNHSIKGMQCYISIKHKNSTYYIWSDGQCLVMNNSRGNPQLQYDLNVERDQARFMDDGMLYECKSACIQHKMFFKSYTMYNLIMNYKKIFQIR